MRRKYLRQCAWLQSDSYFFIFFSYMLTRCARLSFNFNVDDHVYSNVNLYSINKALGVLYICINNKPISISVLSFQHQVKLEKTKAVELVKTFKNQSFKMVFVDIWHDDLMNLCENVPLSKIYHNKPFDKEHEELLVDFVRLAMINVGICLEN